MSTSSRTLLVNPPWYCLQNQRASFIPLGIAYIAGVLKAAGHDVQILDGEQLLGRLTLDPSIPPPGIVVSSIDRYLSFHDPDSGVWEVLAREILTLAPRIVGFSMWTASFQSVINAATHLKKLDPSIIIVVGGIHATIDPMSVIKHSVVDFVVCGEGEQASLKLWDLMSGGEANIRLESTKIEGVWTRLNGNVWNGGKTPLKDDIDDIPFPNYEVVRDLSVQSIAGIITARGCPFGCSFCASQALWTKRVRYRAIAECIRELAYYRSRFDLRKFRINDDTFCLNKDRVKEFCAQLTQLGDTWEFMVDANVNNLDRETISILRRAGCTQINFGIESVAPRIRELFINKRVNLDHAIAMVDEMYRVGIISSVYFMTGFPGETVEELEATISFMEKLRAANNIWSIVSPYPGTALYEYCTANGYLRQLPELHLMHHSLATSMAAIGPKIYGSIIGRIENIVESLSSSGRRRLEHVVDRIDTEQVGTHPWAALDTLEVLTSDHCGCVDELVLTEAGDIAASGWAHNPLLKKPADHVVVLVDGKAFGFNRVCYERPDVADALGNQRLLRTGWRVIIPAEAGGIDPSLLAFVAVSNNLPVGFLENRFNQPHCGRDVGL